MFDILKTSFKVDITSAINSFIYTLNKTPLIKEVVKNIDLYKSKKAKKIITILAFFCTSLRLIIGKFLYLGIIYMTLNWLLKEVTVITFFHAFFFLSIIGMFINNKILTVGRKKYYAVILMGMDAKKYTIAYFLYDVLITFLTNLLSLTVFTFFCFHTTLMTPLIFAIMVVLLKIIGEEVHIYFYQKTGRRLLSQSTIYFLILILGLLLAFFFPYLNIILSEKTYPIIFLVLLLLSIPSLIALFKVENYHLLYKKINTEQAILNSQNADIYSRQQMLEIRKKDYKIDEKKLRDKKGYDYFNTIFFLRHKVILSTSAHIYAFICATLFFIVSVIVYMEPSYQKSVVEFLYTHFAWIFLLMYFVNRGETVTGAMFYNCDRSMLTFNFYKEPKAILNVFKKRLKTVIRINLLPAFMIGVGFLVLSLICTKKLEITYFFLLFVPIMLSIFFSTHHLVIYYLLQPYNVNMQMKSFSYSVASFLTYFICYLLKDIKLSVIPFSVMTMILTISYVVISMVLVYKWAPSRFKLK